MAQGYFINGESLVKVRGHPFGETAATLGIAKGPIIVSPTFFHQPIHTDSQGPHSPANVLWMGAILNIRMILTYFDRDLLEKCIQESMAGQVENEAMVIPGTLMADGTNQAGSLSEEVHFIELQIMSSVANKPFDIPGAYLTRQPFEFPLGTEASAVVLNWEAIAYGANPDGTYNVPGGLTPELWSYVALP